MNIGSPHSLMRWLSEKTTALDRPFQPAVPDMIKAYRHLVECGITFESDKSYEKLAEQYRIYPKQESK